MFRSNRPWAVHFQGGVWYRRTWYGALRLALRKAEQEALR